MPLIQYSRAKSQAQVHMALYRNTFEVSIENRFTRCLYSEEDGRDREEAKFDPFYQIPIKKLSVVQGSTQCFCLGSFEQVQMTKYPLNMTSCGVGRHIVYSYYIFCPPSVCFETRAYSVVPFVLLILGCLLLRCCATYLVFSML